MRIILATDETGSGTESIEVREAGDESYELLETPLLTLPEAYLGDTVRLSRNQGGSYRIRKVIERRFRHQSCIVPGTYGYSKAIGEFGQWVAARGGEWESMMGGILIVHLPDEIAESEVTAELERRVALFLASDEHEALLKVNPGKAILKGLAAQRAHQVGAPVIGKPNTEADSPQ
jgi:hypothetical protein